MSKKRYDIKISDIISCEYKEDLFILKTKWIDLSGNGVCWVNKEIEIRSDDEIDLEIRRNYNPASYCAKVFYPEDCVIKHNRVFNTMQLTVKIKRKNKNYIKDLPNITFIR